jgi:hypothetical protein
MQGKVSRFLQLLPALRPRLEKMIQAEDSKRSNNSTCTNVTLNDGSPRNFQIWKKASNPCAIFSRRTHNPWTDTSQISEAFDVDADSLRHALTKA